MDVQSYVLFIVFYLSISVHIFIKLGYKITQTLAHYQTISIKYGVFACFFFAFYEKMLYIGTNSCGMSNILEAITMGALGVSDNADIGRLVTYGILVTEPDLMIYAFEESFHGGN